MNKLKNQIEGQIQEIVFFGSLLMAFTVFVSGVCYLTFGSSTLELVLGSFGASIDRGFFSAFGYGFFYLAFAALHMGSITNFHIFNFNDFKREYPVLAYSFLAHLILITLFSNLLSVIQFSLEIPATDSLPYGAGGFVGAFIAKGLYSVAGVYGSLLILLTFKIMTGLVAEFFELKDLHQFVKKSAITAQKQSIRLVKLAHQNLTQLAHFFLKGNDFSDMAFQSSQATKSWISNSVHRANHLFTENFHIYNRPTVKTNSPEVKPQKTEKVETKAPRRKSSTSKSASEKLLKNSSMPASQITASKIAKKGLSTRSGVVKKNNKSGQKAKTFN